MADVAELKIKPVLSGNAQSVFRPLSSGLSGLKSVATNVGQTVTGVVKKLTSIPSMIAGFAVYGAGRSFLEATLGSADEMLMVEQRMRGILGSTEKVGQATAKIDQMLKTFPSLNRSDAMAGMEKFLSITNGSIDKSTELLRLAKALEAVAPDQGFEGAMFALKELMEGSPMSIKSRFGLMPTSPEEAKKAAKKEKKTLSDFYLDEVLGQLGKQYGQEGNAVIDFLIGVKSNSIMGRMQRIKSVVTDTLTDLGKEAHKPILDNLGIVADKWSAMVETPQFKQSIVSLSAFFAEAAGAITGKLPGLIDKIPDAMKAVMDAFKAVAGFYERHPTLVKFLGGAAAANWLTGGMLTGAGKSLVGKLASSGLSAATGGKLGGGGCCCDGKGGIGSAASAAGQAEKSLLGRMLSGGKNLLKFGTLAAPTAGLSAAEVAAVSTSGAAIGTALAAAAAPAAIAAIGVFDFSRAHRATAEIGKSRAYDAMAKGVWSRDFKERIAAGDIEGLKGEVTALLGGSDATLSTRKQKDTLDVLKKAMRDAGLTLDLDEGQRVGDIKFGSTWFGGNKDAARALNQTDITVNVQAPQGSTLSPAQLKQVEDSARAGTNAALAEQARTARATR